MATATKKTTAKAETKGTVKPTGNIPQAPQQGEPVLTIPQSMWVKICKLGLKQKFYETDAISRAFMGDDLSDITSKLEEKKPTKK